MWTLPIPQAILDVGFDQESSHPISICESRRLSFWVLESELRYKSNKRSKWRILLERSGHRSLPIMSPIEPTMVSMLWAQRPFSSKHMSCGCPFITISKPYTTQNIGVQSRGDLMTELAPSALDGIAGYRYSPLVSLNFLKPFFFN